MLCLSLAFVSVAAMASPLLPPELTPLVHSLFGDNTDAVLGWAAFVVVLWSQLRQLIPPRWLAKLPRWLVALLEFLAANNGTSRNERVNDPRDIKANKL
ncbi:hypothetical protein [Photobacterium leiognathi]|uniref:hypothetical protein n=1 Tax=Photobacterium leiognathi TaxID=553611 RepID=UPI00273945C0|nr:hypothetical protein [Photobacterium leiognathi]